MRLVGIFHPVLWSETTSFSVIILFQPTPNKILYWSLSSSLGNVFGYELMWKFTCWIQPVSRFYQRLDPTWPLWGSRLCDTVNFTPPWGMAGLLLSWWLGHNCVLPSWCDYISALLHLPDIFSECFHSQEQRPHVRNWCVSPQEISFPRPSYIRIFGCYCEELNMIIAEKLEVMYVQG